MRINIFRKIKYEVIIYRRRGLLIKHIYGKKNIYIKNKRSAIYKGRQKTEELAQFFSSVFSLQSNSILKTSTHAVESFIFAHISTFYHHK